MILNKNERIDDLNINGLKLIQNKEYFLFGMDSVLLASIVKSESKANAIVDLCTGSGVIPILLSSRVRFAKIIGVELQKEMYDIAIKNIELNSLKDKIHVINEDIKNVTEIRKTIMASCTKDSADIVVCNPPYKEIGTGVLNESNVRYNARHETLCNLEEVFKSSSKLLKSRGKLYLVHKPERLADLITIARKYSLEIKNIKILQPKINMKASIVLLEYVKDGGNECKIDPVIIEYDENGTYTNDIKKIYRMGDKNIE